MGDSDNLTTLEYNSKPPKKKFLSKLGGLPYSPPIPLPEGTTLTTVQLSRISETANQLLLPVALVVDACRIGYASYEDYQNGTSRNFVGTTAAVAGGWIGGYTGAMGGAAIGSAIFPGIGTLIGGIVGAVSGGVSMSVATEIMANTIGDAIEYNIEEIECECCKKKFKSRKYRAETFCDQCLAEKTMKTN